MKSEAVIAAFQSFLAGKSDDAISFIRQIEAAELRAGNATVASRLRRMLDRQPRMMVALPMAPDCLMALQPARTMASLILPADVRDTVTGVIQEWRGRDRLIEFGLTPRNVLLLHGPSGNGKTALAEAVAHALGMPLALAKYENMIDSHVGETGKKLAQAFEFARKVSCVLFLDEADSLVASRVAGTSGADREANRVTNSMLVELDRLAASSVVILATNLRGDLDAALSRRMSAELELKPPENGQRETMVRMMGDKWPMIRGGGWESRAMRVDSFAAIERLAMDFARAEILQGGSSSVSLTAEATPNVQVAEGGRE